MDRQKNQDQTSALRNDLKKLDQHLALLLQERFRLVHDLGKIKKTSDVVIEQPEEWERKKKFLKDYLSDDISTEKIINIFETIHKNSVEYQEEL